MESSVEVLELYITAYRELINSKNRSSDKSIKECLHLNKKEDWSFICTAMDIIGDASSAIDNFFRFGLDGPTKYNEVGEKYLRLYGVLNATYIQQQAILNLFKLSNMPNPKEIKSKIENLKIREIRNKLGAHSNDYRHQDNVESYVPIRMELSGHNCGFINNETLKCERVDLKAEIKTHLKLVIELLDKIYEKSVGTFYKGNKQKVDELQENLKDMRIKKAGGWIIKRTDGSKIIITMAQNVDL